ncbi:MAG TPA: metalloregulator ArsR/SmtB family transcription factor [Gemmataceae bacterium]|jgi:ArsR family transcriptional regulator|nr:metalloregulator ArsR/SmtB family transcription factor [Gemmataceae bacterium]
MLDSIRRYKAGIFQALGHPTRIAIVELLNDGELSVGQLCEKVGIEQSNASQHLSVLRNKQIVQTRKVGNQIYYSLSDPVFGQILKLLRAFFHAHMTEALELLQQEQAVFPSGAKASKATSKQVGSR